MGHIATRMGLSDPQVALIRRTAAKDCNHDEFEQFMHVVSDLNLNPLRKQIYAFVYNKDKPDKRSMSIIIGIDGFRAIAERSGNYRPDDTAPEYRYDDALKGDTNPLGIATCSVKCFKRDSESGEWFPLIGFVTWNEFAPISDEWAYDKDAGRRKPTGKQELSGKWRDMPAHMIQKCAEAQALRKGWPEDLSGVYSAEEMERANVIEGTFTEMAEASERDKRLERIGGADAIAITLKYGGDLEPIPLGEFADKVLEAVDHFKTWAELDDFRSRNRYPLREYWARCKADALELNKALADIEQRLKANAA